jgi:hypothetical protein
MVNFRWYSGKPVSVNFFTFSFFIVIDDDLGTEGFVDAGFEDLEVALGDSTCFFVVSDTKKRTLHISRSWEEL